MPELRFFSSAHSFSGDTSGLTGTLGRADQVDTIRAGLSFFLYIFAHQLELVYICISIWCRLGGKQLVDDGNRQKYPESRAEVLLREVFLAFTYTTGRDFYKSLLRIARQSCLRV
jgi:hypothetical protein